MNCATPWTTALQLVHPESVSAGCDQILNLPVTPTHFEIQSYLSVFLLTCVLELPFYFWVLKKFDFKKRTQWLVMANLLTHPAVYFLWPWAFSKANLTYLQFLVFAELFAPLAEAWFIHQSAKISWPRALIAMVAANLCSWGFGSLFSQG